MKQGAVLLVAMLLVVLPGCGPKGEAPGAHPQRLEVDAARAEVYGIGRDTRLTLTKGWE